VQHIKAFRGADAPRGAPSNIAAYDADDFCALLSWILRNQTRDQHLESVERCRGLTNQHNPSRDINMGLLAKGGGAAGLLTLLDQCKSNDSELTTKILYVLCDMANAYKLFTNKSIYGALFVDLGLIRTCMQLISNTRPALASSFATQSSISASTRDNADLVVRTLYPLLILKKDTTIEFFREDGLRVFINLVNAKPRSQATHLALKFFNLLNGLYPGFQEIFRKVEGVEAVASVLTSCAVESESVEEALILLLTYTQSNVGAKTLISTGSIPAVLDIFRQSIAVGGARSKATALALKMISLLGRLSNNCRTMLRDNGVVEVLIELCQEEHAAGRLTSSIVLLSLEALFFLSANNAPIRCAIRKSDGIPMLLDVMAECANCTVRHHWKYALFVLQELAFSCEEARQVVTDLEVIPMLVQLLLKQEEKMTRDLPESRDAEGRRDGLESGLDETAIAAKAAALLHSLAMHSATNKKEIVQLNAIPSLVRLVNTREYDRETLPSGEHVRLAASTALLTLSVGSPANEVRIREAGGPSRRQTLGGVLLPGETLPSLAKMLPPDSQQAVYKRTRGGRRRGAGGAVHNPNLKAPLETYVYRGKRYHLPKV